MVQNNFQHAIENLGLWAEGSPSAMPQDERAQGHRHCQQPWVVTAQTANSVSSWLLEGEHA